VPGLTNLRIAGVALSLFAGILLGVGMHHIVGTGTCSSTGYSANYGPVPHCPSGTGWWMAFLFAGIFGGIGGGLMAGSLALLFAGVFGGIGAGSLTVAFDHGAAHGNKIFGGIFGASFAIVGLGALVSVLVPAMRSLQGGRRSPSAQPAPALAGSAAFGTPATTSLFGAGAKSDDPILGAYRASSSAAQAGVASSPAVSGDSVARLSALAELHRKGDLSNEEFASAKAKLLGEM
jgi:hypothetical protein